MTAVAEKSSLLAYAEPRLIDHGSLAQLTADFDAQFLGSVAKVVVLAQVSTPTVPFTPDTPIPDLEPSDVAGDTDINTPDTGVTPVSDPEPPPPSDPAGDVAGDTAGVGGTQTVAAGDGGKLPFTGFPALTFAALGAGFTTAGVVLRSKLRRR